MVVDKEVVAMIPGKQKEEEVVTTTERVMFVWTVEHSQLICVLLEFIHCSIYLNIDDEDLIGFLVWTDV